MGMSLEDRAAFKPAIEAFGPAIERFCAKFPYWRDPSFGTFPGVRLTNYPELPRRYIIIRHADQKQPGDIHIFTPESLFAIFCGATVTEGNIFYQIEGPFSSTYLEHRTILRRIDKILVKAHASISKISLEQLKSHGNSVDRNDIPAILAFYEKYKHTRGDLANRVLTESELDSFLNT